MKRLIDANALKKHLHKDPLYPLVEKYGMDGVIDAQPTVDAEPVRHGKWIEGKCNRCGEHAPFWSMATTYYRSNYCPHCGARMDEE